MPTADTRTAILDAGELLFAEAGYSGVSLREITRHADVNVAAIHYHFGGKEEVLRSVTDRIIGPLNQRRLGLLEATLRRNDPAPIDEIMDAFVRPDIETLQRLSERGPATARLLGRIYSDPTPWIREMSATQFSEIRRLIFPAIGASVPHLDDESLAWRMERVTAVIVDLFLRWPEAGMTDAEAERTIGRLVAVFSAMLTVPEPT